MAVRIIYGKIGFQNAAASEIVLWFGNEFLLSLVFIIQLQNDHY